MRMNGAQLIIKLLERQEIETVAGIPGGANLPLYHALAHSRIRHVLARHEQGAGFIAHGMARSTGMAAVCFVTSGPGVTNMITALADAMLDSVPIIVICGQVPTDLLGTDAFQEINTIALAKPVSKRAFLVKRAQDLLKIIPEAFTLALSGRPGPVVIDVPKDVQRAQVEFGTWPAPGGKIRLAADPAAAAGALPEAANPLQTTGGRREAVDTDEMAAGERREDTAGRKTIKQIAAAINRAEKPLLYVGGGVVASGTHNELVSLSRTAGIPVVSTLMGLGCFPADDPLFLGMLGMHGSRATNHILDKADLLIALGVRFDDRATGRVSEFCPRAEIIHIDIDSREIHKIKRADLSLVGDLAEVLPELLPLIIKRERTSWRREVEHTRERLPELWSAKSNGSHPRSLLRRLRALLPEDTIVTTDVGQHQMWTAQGFGFNRTRTLLTSGGLGTMGFGLPAAIGAALANPGRRVLCISGDGSLYMNIQELATLAELDLDVTVILFNNNELGLVRQQQELFYEKIFSASRFSLKPDFAALAGEFGIRGKRLESAAELPAEVAAAAEGRSPLLIDVPISAEENVYPMVPPGRANREMLSEDDECPEGIPVQCGSAAKRSL